MAKRCCCTSQLYRPIRGQKRDGTPLAWASDLRIWTVKVARRYSNRPDLLEQLRKTVGILSGDGHGGNTGAEVAVEGVVRSRRLRDRFRLRIFKT